MEYTTYEFDLFATRFVPLFTANQLARFFELGEARALAVCNTAVKQKRFCSMSVLTQIPKIEAPLCSWAPGEPMPNVASISYRARNRHFGSPPKQLKLFYASTNTARYFGIATSLKPKVNDVIHSLGVSECCLFFRRRWPRLTMSSWQSEHCFAVPRPEPGSVNPDAFLINRTTGRIQRMIEYVGLSYRKERVNNLIEHALREGVAIDVI